MIIFRKDHINLLSRKEKIGLKIFIFLFIFYILNRFFILDSIVDLFLDTKEIPYSKTISKNKDELSVHILDVGQSESILITQNNSVMLIDAALPEYGPSICKYIQSLGFNKIDILILTHPHIDHIGGASKIIRTMDVRNIYISDTSSKLYWQNFYYWNIERIAFFKGINLEYSKTGETISFGESNLKFIAPISYKYDNLNNYSIGIKLSYKNFSFLSIADAQAEVEEELLSSSYNITSKVLKISHHGSITSSTDEFINVIHPDYAVLSVGNDNTYGHPTKTVMRRFEKSKIPVYITDELGTVVITTDGNIINFNTKSGDYMYRKYKK